MREEKKVKLARKKKKTKCHPSEIVQTTKEQNGSHNAHDVETKKPL